MSKKIKVAYVFPGKSSFAQQDMGILKRNFDVSIVNVGKKKTNFVRKVYIVLKIFRSVAKSNVSFAWFANNHAYAMVKLAKLLGKKSIVVVGGFEVACEPEIRYGALLKPVLAKRVKYILNNADKIISVSEFSENDILKISKPKKLKVIHNSIDTNKFRSDQKKEDIVITIGNSTNARCKLKGIDTFVKASAKFPSTKFVVIGDYDIPILKKLKEIQPNVHFTGLIPHEEVVLWLKKAKVYCQLSYYESFGVALIEAMSCECVPVITERGAMPEVAGDAGFVVPYGNPEATAEAIKKALSSKNGPAARQRVLELFDTQERERKLVNVIYEILE